VETITSEAFLRWAAGGGIGFDPRYPQSGCLRLLPRREHARFWVLPPDPAALPHFTASLLDGLDEWDNGFLWPRSDGRWPDPAQTGSYSEGVRDVLLRGADIPAGWVGAVRFGRDEEDALLAVLYAFVVFGWCVDDDLFFVPDHGRQLIHTDHHDVIHVECASEERIQRLVAHMAEAGYELPRELPDATFKRPAWMDHVDPIAPTERPPDSAGDSPPF
jgi:hypothetical protein